MKAFMRNARDMKVMGGKKEEEGRIFIFFDPLLRFLHPLIGEVFIAKTGGMTAGVEPNSANTIMDGSVMAVRPIHFKGIPMADASGCSGVGFL